MFDWELRDPWFLLLLALVPLIYRLRNRWPAVLGFSSLTLVAETPATWRARLTFIPPLIMAAATAVLVLALARPRTPQAETRVSREGIAIMMVVDVS